MPISVMVVGGVLGILKNYQLVGKEIKLTQKLEKSLKSIKFFFNNYSFFWAVLGYIFFSALFIVCILYYEDFFSHIFSCSVRAVTLEDYLHNQPPLIKLLIKLVFDEPPYYNKN